jgi:hypothetical protein
MIIRLRLVAAILVLSTSLAFAAGDKKPVLPVHLDIISHYFSNLSRQEIAKGISHSISSVSDLGDFAFGLCPIAQRV